MSTYLNSVKKRKSAIVGIAVFSLLLFITEFSSYLKYQLLTTEEHQTIVDAANTTKNQLENSLNQSYSAARTLAFVVEKYGVPKDFNTISESLIGNSNYIDAMQLVQGGVITHCYPLEGNEAVIGYNILEDSTRNKEALKAIEKRQMFFAGPFSLKQGGIGVVGRIPIFINNNFFGFAAVIIKLETLIKATKIDIEGDKKYDYQLSKINPDTGIEEYFFSNEVSFNKQHSVSVEIPNGEWKLYVKSKTNLPVKTIIPFVILGFLLSATGGIFAWYYAKQPNELRKLVTEKTEQISKSESRFRLLFDKVTNISVQGYKADGTVIFWNEASEKIYGYTKEEALGKKLWDLIIPEHMTSEVKKAVMQMTTNQQGHPAEKLLLKNKYGQQVPVYSNHTILNTLDNDVELFCIDIDLTEQIKNENQIKWLINNTEEAFVLMDKNLNIISFNNQYEKLYTKYFKIPVKRGASILDYVQPERLEIVKEIYKNVLSGKTEASQITIPLENENKIIFDLKFKPATDENNNIIGVFVSAANVTEKIIAQNKLQQSKDELQNILDSSLDMICTLNKEGLFVNVSAAAEKILGYTPNELEGKSYLEVIHPDDLDNTNKIAAEVVAGTNVNNFENRYIHKNGNSIPLIWSIRWSEKDQLVYCVAKDATSILEAEKQIRESEALMNEAQKIAKMGNWNFDFRTDRLTWSDALYDVFDVDKETFKETHGSFVSLVDAEYQELVIKTSTDAQKTGKPFNIQYGITTPSGEKRIIEEYGYVEKDENDNVLRLYGTAQNITERKKAELEILRFKKIVESSKDGIALADKNGNSIYLNPAFAEALGYSLGSLESKGGPPYVYADKEKAKEVFGTLLSGNYWKGDIELINNKGEILDYYLSGGPIYDDNNSLVAIYGIHTDISERKKNELALKHAYEEKNTILESITDNFYALDKFFNITYINQSAKELLNLTDNHIEKNLFDLFPEMNNTLFSEKLIETSKFNTPAKFEFYYEPYERWYDESIYPTATGYSVFFRDITEQKIATESIRKSNERFEYVTKATFDSIWDWDLTTGEHYMSSNFEEIFGYKLENNIVPVSFWEKNVHPEDRDYALKSLYDAKDNLGANTWKCEYRYYRNDGTIAYVVDKAVILRDKTGKAIRMIGAMQDITMNKEYEISLRKLNETLRLKTIELSRSNSELEQFAYVASHDLQEPLRMVTSFLSKIEEKYNHLLDEKGKKYIFLAVDGATRMRKIILDLLEYSRSGTSELTTENIDIKEVIQDVIKLNSKAIHEQKAIITYDDLPNISASSTAINQIFRNLIGNALKYSKANTPPKIHIGYKETDTHWQFYVKDNGIGISSEFFDKLFILFQRLHEKNEYSGTGIGLAVCKKFIERHNGEIWLASQEGVGTTFYFTIKKHIK